jgi:hypothetical protein
MIITGFGLPEGENKTLRAAAAQLPFLIWVRFTLQNMEWRF